MVIVFGSINLDLIFAVPHIPAPGETVLGPSVMIQPGGKGANQAVAAARDGARVVMAGAVGRDSLAVGATELLRAANVDLTRVVESASGTGCAAIAVDPAGENAIAVGSGANLAARQMQIEDALLVPDATLLLQMEVPAEETAALIRRAHARGTRIVLNLAPAAAVPEDALRKVSILVANETEAAWLTSGGQASGGDASDGRDEPGHDGKGWPVPNDPRSERPAVGDAGDTGNAGEAINIGDTGNAGRTGKIVDGRGKGNIGDAGLLHRRFGIPVVRTLGADGLECATAAGVETIPAFPITPVDTTAAGDCFVGVLAAALDRGATLPDALRRANAAAALCCMRRGSQVAIPTAAETDAFLARHP